MYRNRHQYAEISHFRAPYKNAMIAGFGNSQTVENPPLPPPPPLEKSKFSLLTHVGVGLLAVGGLYLLLRDPEPR